ncbi:hypothetical protein F511_26699 [Dorcoceras hygrometricum]|uniref:Uncharacterized protein n=1 Tax=Dorcoceras hygrometricum TaxID=472368 RepID=A0A2Z7BL88_9LAMI|nr:hypothetical protein F511_26699 [Dorcoceras hygrometricum]
MELERREVADEKSCARFGMSCDDISLDKSSFSRKLSADEEKSERAEATSRELQRNQQMLLELAIAKRCRLHKLIRQRFAVALKIQQEDFALMFNQQAQRNQQVATALPVVVKSSRLKRRSRRSEEMQPVARFSRKIQQKRKISSSRLESAGAKQLTTYEELRELDVNC